jgi:hypothetical protein
MRHLRDRSPAAAKPVAVAVAVAQYLVMISTIGQPHYLGIVCGTNSAAHKLHVWWRPSCSAVTMLGIELAVLNPDS